MVNDGKRLCLVGDSKVWRSACGSPWGTLLCKLPLRRLGIERRFCENASWSHQVSCEPNTGGTINLYFWRVLTFYRRASQMRALVLFKGTGSIDKELTDAGWEVDSLDILKKFEPTFCCDITKWDYKVLAPGYYDFIWASPVCTEFSIALTARPRKLEVGDILAKKAVEILEHFKPKYWALENPGTGYLKTRPYIQGLPFQDLCYCKYSGYRYKKWTRIWDPSSQGQCAPKRADARLF